MKHAAKMKYRLTLRPEALALAISRKSPLAGEYCIRRPDGKWEAVISLAMAQQLVEDALPNENLSDTVLRILSKPTEQK